MASVLFFTLVALVSLYINQAKALKEQVEIKQALERLLAGGGLDGLAKFAPPQPALNTRVPEVTVTL